MSGWAPRRFWTVATVAPDGDGFGVALDGRPVRTPLRAVLRVPTRAFADEVAREWAAVDGTVDPAAMPATRLANAAIDKVRGQRAEVVAMLAGYGGTDLLCYRAEGPMPLVQRQAEGWDPLLGWAEAELGARLSVGKGVMPVDQSPDDLARLRAPMEPMDEFELSAFHDLVTLSGSLVLGHAVVLGRLSPEEAWRLSRLDEDFQVEQWGEDEEAAAAASRRRAAFLDAARFHAMLADGRPRSG